MRCAPARRFLPDVSNHHRRDGGGDQAELDLQLALEMLVASAGA